MIILIKFSLLSFILSIIFLLISDYFNPFTIIRAPYSTTDKLSIFFDILSTIFFYLSLISGAFFLSFILWNCFTK